MLAAINHHFGTRQELLEALLRDGGRRLDRRGGGAPVREVGALVGARRRVVEALDVERPAIPGDHGADVRGGEPVEDDSRVGREFERIDARRGQAHAARSAL